MLPENQKLNNIYISLDKLLKNLDNDNWFINYLTWELNLISNLGFGFDTNKLNKNPDKKNFNIVGWQTEDLYQNLTITYIYGLKINKIINEKIFELPELT